MCLVIIQQMLILEEIIVSSFFPLLVAPFGGMLYVSHHGPITSWTRNRQQVSSRYEQADALYSRSVGNTKTLHPTHPIDITQGETVTTH